MYVFLFLTRSYRLGGRWLRVQIFAESMQSVLYLLVGMPVPTWEGIYQNSVHKKHGVKGTRLGIVISCQAIPKDRGKTRFVTRTDAFVLVH
jgi:hypothetical protein